MQRTAIGWCDYSWPVINGCRRISPGCGGPDGGGCYAERLAATRLSKTGKYQGLATMTKSGPRWTGETSLWESEFLAPIKLRTPAKVFVCDMGDLFYDAVPDEWIDRVFGMMWNASWHTYQVLTKRAERMYTYLTTPGRAGRIAYAIYQDFQRLEPEKATLVTLGDFVHDIRLPLPHVWCGVSVEDQPRADARIQWLRETPAAVRFISFEPLLGPVQDLDLTGIHWSIVGGESGPGYRHMQIEWLESIVNQCRAENISCFVKQDSGLRPGRQGRIPDALWIREFPHDPHPSEN